MKIKIKITKEIIDMAINKRRDRTISYNIDRSCPLAIALSEHFNIPAYVGLRSFGLIRSYLTDENGCKIYSTISERSIMIGYLSKNAIMFVKKFDRCISSELELKPINFVLECLDSKIELALGGSNEFTTK